jgi:hypothetical protein
MEEFTMKAIQGYIITAAAAFAGSALAGSFPTTWHIVNSTDQTIDIACSGKGLGGSQAVELAKKVIKSGETIERVWSEEWYNDGLGLQAAIWECKTGFSGGALTKSGGFSTDWGQDMILSIAQSKSGLIVRPQDKKGDIAKAGTEKDKQAK